GVDVEAVDFGARKEWVRLQRAPRIHKNDVTIAMPRLGDARALCEPAATGPAAQEYDRVGLRVRCCRLSCGDSELNGTAVRPGPILGNGKVSASKLVTQIDAGEDGVR